MMRINDFTCKATLKAAVMSVFFLSAAAAAFGQQQINLTVAPTTATLPDGTMVPMWGYFCGAAVTGSTATCAALNPASVSTTAGVASTWSPVVITVPTGTTATPASLQINLTNNLSFTPTGSTTANTIPTSIVIVGQVGGGLGGAPTTTPSPSHTDAQGCPTWFIASGATPPGVPCPAPQPGASNLPPVQGPRVQSMGTEVAAVAAGTAATPTSLTWANLKPGTYLLESGTHPSIQVPMGLIGVLVVTTAPSGTTAGAAYPAVGTAPAVPYNAEVPLEFSEIDPVQNSAVNTAVNTAGFSETKVWSGMVGQCGNSSSPAGVVNTCYPPAVNYTPLYYLINGVAFSKNNAAASVFQATAGVAGAPPTPVIAGITGTVLVRVVNAGSRLHVPSIVNSLTQGFNGAGAAATVAGFTVIAEDGNVLPNVAPPGATVVPAAPRVQTDVLMVPSKVYDLLVNVPATAAGATAPPSLPVYDRELSLSGNSSVRDAGMLAYISVNGSGLPVAAGTGVFTAAVARADTYNGLAAGQVFSVADTSKGVIANDTNVYGVALLTAPTNGTLTCNARPQFSTPGICANGTFAYTPSGTATSDSFTYCANGTVTGATCSSGLTATVTLSASSLAGNPTAVAQTYTAKTATYIKIPSPGLLVGNSDPNNLPLSLVVTTPPAGVELDANGGFTVLNPTPSTTAATTFTFSYTVQNSQGRTATGTATVNFPTPSNLQVKVLDAQLYKNCNLNSACIASLTALTDYRWIIEEDKTFWVDPNCTTNSSITTPGCPAPVTSGGTIPSFGVNFHTSTADFVAQGCTGPLSCEGGQTMLDNNPSSSTFGQHIPAVCDVGNGACRPDTTGNGFTQVNPSQVHLDPAKRYYISVLPGDAANPFPSYLGQPVCSATGGNSTSTQCGHTMSGAPIPPACNILGGTSACPTTGTAPAFASVTVLVLPTPLPTGKLSVIVFEDDFPLNGEQDGGGGNGTVAPIEPGLGGFNLVLWDTFGGLGDVTGQDTYDAFNQPLSNSLAGTIDPSTGFDACPISPQITANSALATTPPGNTTQGGDGTAVGSQKGLTGMIVTCPKYESDNQTLSPLAGQAIIANLMPEKFSVQAYPAADRIARGEQWVQTNTLDGQHPHDSFIRIGEPSYFQEYGPAGYHVAIGFANPAIINARHNDVCSGFGSPGTVGPCTNTITGQVDVQRISRTPDQRLYPSGSRDGLAWTQCWVSLGDPDGEDFMFSFCDAQGNFKFTNVPGGFWRLTIGDQWNDQIIDGLSTPANVGCTSNAPNGTTNATTCPGGQTLNMGHIGVQQWQANLYTRTFIDDNKNGIWDPGEIGIPFLYTRIKYRDGHNANSLVTDFNGVANFNETYPLFNWYVVEADSTRYKTTGIHTVYDAGGPADGSPACGNGKTSRQCGTSTAYNFLSNTFEGLPVPADLSVPGAVYCAKADCTTEATSFAAGTAIASSSTASTGRIDPPWVWAEGWTGLTSHSNWIDFGKAPYAACPPACATVTTTPAGGTATTTQVAENGGIHGFVDYAATRPFDDASQMIQQPWEPYIPRVTINLYQEGFAADGVTPTLTWVDTTQTTSWDDWAQGFYPNSTATPGTGQTSAEKPYMNCPGQGTATGTNADLFFFTLFDQPNYLDFYNSLHNGGTLHTLPYNSQYKCYDSMHIGNQLQPAPYDGRYFFPSSLGINPTTGKPVTPTGYINPITGVASTTAVTNCTICVPNPDTTDKYRVGTPMLPPGKYVVQVIMPPGYEVYKEEDKNLLIGDNFIAPASQEFAGLGTDIFIIPDQASVASLYDPANQGFNPTNYQDSTVNLGLNEELSGVPGFPGFQDPVWPCVGEMRTVPDYLSLFPHAQEVAPFAGATRPLCDRKEVTLVNQMAVDVKFYIFTSTHIASKYTGVITDDFTSEFDPFSPQFGEKFSPPNLPVSTRDYLGNEISRVYSDHWGTYDGLTFSSWEVNPPNITGYSPTMMTQCMNDPGPILDTRTGSATLGQMITDPLYNSNYSDFCYELPYMPGLTNYADTPVVPTAAFVGAAYNSPDCAYPDTTPAIKEVDGDGIGPWVSAANHTLTITALGDVQVSNEAYSGPSASVAPFNLKTITRHYGFGSQCLGPTAGSTTCNTLSSVTIGGVSATINGWSDTQITLAVPPGVPNCAIQQQAQYGGSLAQCGQVLITAGNGKQSIDSVTVTIGGKTPTHVSANQTIQGAIDAASPGDLIMVDPTCMTAGTTTTATCSTSALHAATPTQTASVGSHTELLIMWKPVRLQGVGAATSIINANAFPAGQLLDPWRRHINCLFGLSLSGTPTVGNGTGAAPVAYDPTGTYSCPDNSTGDTWNFFTTPTTLNVPQIDRLPLEAIVGWNATVNGNLAEQLQEPSLMGAYEGAGITVLGKGVWTSPGENIWTDTSEGGAFPSDALLLQDVPATLDDEGGPLGPQYSYCWTTTATGSTTTELVPNPYPSNFECNPSSIDGLSVTNSSQGGGGIFVHGWAHNLQIANNRVYNNAGTLSGGINVGQGEFPIAITVVAQEGAATTGPTGQFDADAPPSCVDSLVLGTHLPYCLDVHVNVHNNNISSNSSLGDELFSGTLAGGGGVSFCTGSDYYKFQYNWVCGNLSSAEGGGVAHIGFIYNGDIEHNTILLNQSTNPTIPTNGGGIIVMGTPDTDPVCGTQIDQDCPPGLSDGTGPGLVINANLIQANFAESGSGGGIRLQQVNGTDVSTFPTLPGFWNSVSITNNIIVNNVAGWDGAGISLQDSLNVNIVQNTIAHNDSLASSGVLTQSIGTPEASAPAGSCVQGGPGGATSASCPQSAGVTSTTNSSLLTTTFTGLTITCPPGHYAGGTANNGTCTKISYPAMYNDLLYQNRSYYIGITGPGSGNLNQQNLVALFPAFSTTAAASQTSTGSCLAFPNGSYWDIGVRGDASPTSHSSGFTITPNYTATTSTFGPGANNVFISQYCNGSRVPPECTVADGCGGPGGYGVPPGIVDASTPNPVFTLTPSATVDEGNNWINVSWGPLAVTNDSVQGPDGNYGGGPLLGNYALAPNSPAIDGVPANEVVPPSVGVPATDFFGNPRPNPDGDLRPDYGAVETQGARTVVTPTLTSISPASGVRGTTVNVTLTGTNLTGASNVTVSGAGITVSGIGVESATTVVATFTIAATAGTTARNVAVVTPGGTTNTVTFTVTAPTATISPASGERGTTVPVTITAGTGTNLTGATGVTMSGAGVTCTITGTTTATTVTASCVIAAAAGLTARTVTVPGTASGTVTVSNTFQITGAALTFSGPSPAMTTTPGNTTTKTGTITVTNTTGATAGAFTFNAAPTVTKVGTAGGTFSIVAPASGTQCTSTTVLAAGGSCTIGVQYAPGTSTATATAHVTVTGTGLATATASDANFTAN
jgi:hypothetical protein